MDPQNCAAREPYRPPAAWYQRLNHIGVPLTSWGLAPRDAVTLVVVTGHSAFSTGRPAESSWRLPRRVGAVSAWAFVVLLVAAVGTHPGDPDDVQRRSRAGLPQ
jgi:hypothetical protein